jgi:hypothetical protein
MTRASHRSPRPSARPSQHFCSRLVNVLKISPSSTPAVAQIPCNSATRSSTGATTNCAMRCPACRSSKSFTYATQRRLMKASPSPSTSTRCSSTPAGRRSPSRNSAVRRRSQLRKHRTGDPYGRTVGRRSLQWGPDERQTRPRKGRSIHRALPERHCTRNRTGLDIASAVSRRNARRSNRRGQSPSFRVGIVIGRRPAPSMSCEGRPRPRRSSHSRPCTRSRRCACTRVGHPYVRH